MNCCRGKHANGSDFFQQSQRKILWYPECSSDIAVQGEWRPVMCVDEQQQHDPFAVAVHAGKLVSGRHVSFAQGRHEPHVHTVSAPCMHACRRGLPNK